MANEAEEVQLKTEVTRKLQMPNPGESITVTDISDFCENISSFYLKRQFSDITIIFNGHTVYAEFFAHKVILAARCKYFETLFANSSQQPEIVINDASPKAFQKVLKFIYTGSTTFSPTEIDLIFEVMQLASKYSLKNLEKGISEKMVSIVKMDNVFSILNIANDHEMEGLRNICHKFMDGHSSEILKNLNITNLTQKSMVKLLERDSFGAPEIEIFRSVTKWRQINTDIDNLVVNCVRLSLLTNDEILSTVYPSKLVEDYKLLAVMAKTVNERSRSGHMLSIKDTNLATPEQAEVISGINTNYLLDKSRVKSNTCAYHTVSDKNGIIVKLKAPCYVNHIHMELWNDDFKWYSYYIEVSLDDKNWDKVVDYSQYRCHSYQHLYFEQKFVQFIKIVGIYCSQSEVDSGNSYQGPRAFTHKPLEHKRLFKALSRNEKVAIKLKIFKIYLTSVTPKLTNGLVHPVENVVTSEKGATVIQGSSIAQLETTTIKPCLLTGDDIYRTTSVPPMVMNLDSSQGNAIIVQLAQPYVVQSMKLRSRCNMNFMNMNMIRCKIETSLDKYNWRFVGHSNREGSWENLHFDERPVVYIRITSQSFGRGIECVDLECPSREK